MNDKTQAVLNVLTQLARKGKTQGVRVISNRFKVHTFSDTQGKVVFFVYDKKFSRATKLIKRDEALFKDGEWVWIIGKYSPYKGRIVMTTPARKLITDQDFTDYGMPVGTKVRGKTYFNCPAYVIEIAGKLRLYGISQLRKAADVRELVSTRTKKARR